MAGKPLNGKGRRARGEGTLEQRGPERWRLRVYAGRDPLTGRPKQASKIIHARTRTLALKALREFAVEVDKHGVPHTVTVKELLDRWTTEFLPGEGKAQTTLESYQGVIDNHLIPAFGHVELQKLTAYHLDRYYRAQQRKGMKPRTVRMHHAILSSALNQALRWEWIARNPAQYATPPKVPRGMQFIPEIEQIRNLIAAAGDNDDLVALVRLAAITGARRGELCGLKWSDWDERAGTLLVERQRVRVKGGDITAPLKVGDGGKVALGMFGTEALTRYKAATEARARDLGVEPDWDGWLLSFNCGRSPLNVRWVNDAITGLGKKAEVPVTPHAFRRFAATFMVASGVDVRTAAGRLRHTPEMLMRVYAGFVPARDEIAAELLGAAITGP